MSRAPSGSYGASRAFLLERMCWRYRKHHIHHGLVLIVNDRQSVKTGIDVGPGVRKLSGEWIRYGDTGPLLYGKLYAWAEQIYVRQGRMAIYYPGSVGQKQVMDLV